VIAARGFEHEPYFSMAAIDIRGLPKLEGTVHVNMALIIKFMANYFFAPAAYPEVPRRDEGSNDSFLFDQGPTKGLGSIRFHDYRLAYDSFDTPNLRVFKEQIELLKQMAVAAPMSKEQQKDIDFMLTVGEMFTLVVYGQLILENARIYGVDANRPGPTCHRRGRRTARRSAPSPRFRRRAPLQRTGTGRGRVHAGGHARSRDYAITCLESPHPPPFPHGWGRGGCRPARHSSGWSGPDRDAGDACCPQPDRLAPTPPMPEGGAPFPTALP